LRARPEAAKNSALPNLEACLPSALQGPNTQLSRIAAGLSGAGVYRVEAAGETFVLKVASPDEPLGDWQRKLATLRQAAQAGLAPRVLHADESRRAIVSAFVVDRSFAAFYGDPRTRVQALELLGQTMRRVHALPVSPEQTPADPRAMLGSVWSRLTQDFTVPAFVTSAVERLLAERVPPSERALVLSHNDVNPTNLVYDGQSLLLLDWDTAAPNDPFYDIAAVSVFFRMDDHTTLSLLGAHDGAKPSALPAGLAYQRRLVAVLCGVVFLNLARHGGYPGSTGSETLESTLGLGDFYERLRSGASSIASAEGQWGFGLALLKAGATL
jgi:aminoglycoside phosphotransferase (APT) family kinase protein